MSSRPDKTLTLSQIEEILQKCYIGMSESVLDRDEASVRARMVYEDMMAVDFPLCLDCGWPVQFPGAETIWIPSYQLPEAGYGPIIDPEGENGRDAAGPLLSCGEFIRLSRACKLGRDILTPKRWPIQLKTRLQASEHHLAVIEEIVWLGRWHSPRYVKMTYRHNPETNNDVDWRFNSCGQVINLEVKTRRRDWMGVTDGTCFSRDFDSYFEDLEGKFGPQKNGELNIVAVTTFAPPEASLRRCTTRFLDTHPEIDAVVFWSLHQPNGDGLEIHAKEPDRIRLFLKGPEREDELFVAPIRHLWRNREERRALRADEAIVVMKKLSSDSMK